MNGWQMAMELYRAMPTSLADRRPMNDTTGRVKAVKYQPTVTHDEVAAFRDLASIGWSNERIALAMDRSKDTVYLYLTGKKVVRG